MDVQLHAKNLELGERLRTYAEKKLARLDRYLPSITQVTLELSEEHRRSGRQSVAQLTVRDRRGTILRAEERTEGEIYAAIDIVVDKMYRQISRYKGKRRRRAGDKFEVLEPELAAAETPEGVAEEEEPMPQIVRRKRIEVLPMSEEEAIDQMELLGHDFFMFFNAETHNINVLYRRKDGGFGLLQPLQ
ncbi:MAG: ribosomal subunit interface protein [Candidatus Thermofonsia Clade 1 bacterium]|jgi:putative sigma-54 modulation protein|uniref:Ribosome hibernation promoting factor n=1 Tax=Candidatus Thermofonsia Clade 1 bacterium TaxID=2364210 RepID=A0A2M8PAC3_9CHLR|nr:MAG: ribosomal subunit interface protein [Candidatus Thermofonsia Clade 1 bacterium]